MGINKDQLEELITETLIEINMHSQAAVNLLMGTAAQESHLGTYIKQVKGPAKGIFQMEPATHDDIWNNFLDYKSTASLSGLFSKVMLPNFDSDNLVYNLKYAIIMCRLHYMRVPEPLPDYYNVHGLGLYWKTHYNTKLGKGTVKEFQENYKRFVE